MKVSDFPIGQKVEIKHAVHPFRIGTVIRNTGSEFVDIKRDYDGYVGGWFPYNLVSVEPVVNVLQIARELAVKLANDGGILKQTNVDEVQFELGKLGHRLGNQAGQIFKGPNWRNTGTTVKSVRAGNNSRRISVWRYVDNVIPFPTPEPPVPISGVAAASTKPLQLVPATKHNLRIGTKVISQHASEEFGKTGKVVGFYPDNPTYAWPVRVLLDGDFAPGAYKYSELALSVVSANPENIQIGSRVAIGPDWFNESSRGKVDTVRDFRFGSLSA